MTSSDAAGPPASTCLDCPATIVQRAGRGRRRLRCDACNDVQRAASRHRVPARKCARCRCALPFGGRKSYCDDCASARLAKA